MKVSFPAEVARAGAETLKVTVTAEIRDAIVLIRDVQDEQRKRIPVSDFPGEVLMAWRKRAREEAKRA